MARRRFNYGDSYARVDWPLWAIKALYKEHNGSQTAAARATGRDRSVIRKQFEKAGLSIIRNHQEIPMPSERTIRSLHKRHNGNASSAAREYGLKRSDIMLKWFKHYGLRTRKYGSIPYIRCIPFVYFIKDDDYCDGRVVKIGKSHDMYTRMKAHKVDLPNAYIMGVITCKNKDHMDATEEKWHDKFSAQWYAGEWFRLTPALRKAIERETEKFDWFDHF